MNQTTVTRAISVTPQSSRGRENEHRPPETTRRTALRRLGLAGTALLSGCIARPPGEQRADDVDPSPSSVFTATFDRVGRADAYRLSYRWRHRDRRWRLPLSVERSEYESAVAAERSVPRCYDDALTAPLADRVATALSERLDAARVESAFDRLRAATAFVRSRRYVTDEAATGEIEYPKYVAETLVENGGDCEDFAVLLAGVLAASQFGYDPHLVFFPSHVGLGLDPAAVEIEDPPLVTAGDRTYYYVDATIPADLGAVPDEYDPDGVVAVYDGTWRVCDLPALCEHVADAVVENGVGDPLDYV